MNRKFPRVIKHFSKESRLKSWDTYRALLGRLCQSRIHEPHAKKILGLLRNQDVMGLVEFADSLVSQKYDTAELHFSANQFAMLIRKFPFPSKLNPFDPDKTAREKYLKTEDSCSLVNKRFKGGVPELEHSLHQMRGFISYVLGVSPQLRKIYKHCDFGPGASLGTHGNATNKARKIASNWTVSPQALAYAYGAVSSNWQLFEILLEKSESGICCIDSDFASQQFHSSATFVSHNKIAFAPKTVRVSRPIAVEPLWNGFVQKGIDVYMRSLLLKVGIDLSDQTVNQEWARLGSLDDSENGFVTIDLSSASDSIAKEVVRTLLPHDWYCLLDNIRSQDFMDENGICHTYEKFCSMGNGFCFPLETLLFAAACSSVGAGVSGIDFIVYGDDIILRKKYADAVVTLLGELGFRTNEDKTFLQGPFRESCGTDWFGGEDVRPFTLDFGFDSLESFFKYLNLSERNERSTAFFAPVREFIISLIPTELRFCRSRDGNPDSGFQVSQDVFLVSPYTKWHKALQCWSWLELISSSVSDNWKELRYANYSHVYAALSGASSSQPFTVRRKTKVTVRRIAYG